MEKKDTSERLLYGGYRERLDFQAGSDLANEKVSPVFIVIIEMHKETSVVFRVFESEILLLLFRPVSGVVVLVPSFPLIFAPRISYPHESKVFPIEGSFLS